MQKKELKIMNAEKIEDIVLRHSKRGMNVLRAAMPNDYCREAAEMILSWPNGIVFLATGFYVAGFAETDGPVGTVTLASALKALGYHPVIITDIFCKGFFEPKNLDVIYMDITADWKYCEDLLQNYSPVGLISIERCGKNINNDYANMRGISIVGHTAPIDCLFESALGKIPTIGIGDGGNEIGMGNIAELITDQLELIPCKVCVDQLVIATVSNWGAYAITAYLAILTGEDVFPAFQKVYDYIKMTVDLGSVDGVTKEHIVGVDGFSMEIEEEIVTSLQNAIDNS